MAKFVGSYAADVQKLTVASLLSGQHAHFVGAPGYGKTSIVKSVLRSIYGDAWGFVGVNPATRPEEVEGAIRLDVLMNESRIERNVLSGLYNPAFKAVMIDEFSRANDVVLNQMIQLLDRQQAPVDTVPALCTANFLVKDTKFEAVYDRLALWGWINPAGVDAGSIIEAQLGALSSGGRLDAPLPTPTAEEIATVRAMTPSVRSIAAIRNLVEQIAVEAQTSGYGINPRRLSQWALLLFFTSAYHAGTNDFGTIPNAAVDTLRYAYPCRTQEQAAEWAQIANSVGDPIQAAIDAILVELVEKYNQLAGRPASEFFALGGVASGSAEKALNALNAPDDPRIREASSLIREWGVKIMRGEKIVR